jgi:hypothetical protein
MNSVIDLSKAERGQQAVVPASDASAIIQVIERAARDPSVDIVKMKELFAMRKEIMLEVAEAAFNSSMNAAQKEMRPIAADAENTQTRSKYATYAKLDRALRPIYTKHGFAISYDEGDSPKPDNVRCLAYVSHPAGFTRTYRRDMPADGKGAKGGDVMTKTHAVGAAHSYGDRYLLKGIFNIAVGEDDNDGNYDEGPMLTADQVKQVERRLNEANVDLAGFLEFWQVAEIAHIPACNFALIMQRLDKAAKRIDPRGDTSNVPDPLRDKWVSSITDILAQDKDEHGIASDLQDVAAELNKFPELYMKVLDELARKKIITKANWKKFTAMLVDRNNHQ